MLAVVFTQLPSKPVELGWFSKGLLNSIDCRFFCFLTFKPSDCSNLKTVHFQFFFLAVFNRVVWVMVRDPQKHSFLSSQR